VEEDAFNNVNPFRSPATVDVAETIAAGPSEQTLGAFAIRTMLFFVALGPHLYFWLMVLTLPWESNYIGVKWCTAFGCAFVCLVATGTILVAVVRRANTVAFLAFAIGIASFGILLMADWCM